MPRAKDIDAELLQVRERIITELRTLDQGIIDARARADALRTTLRGLEATLGIDEPPKGSAAVEAVAREHYKATGGTSLMLNEIVEQLTLRGWSPDSDRPEQAVRSAVRRLCESDPRWRFEKGRMFFAWTEDDEAALHDRVRDEVEESFE